MPLLLLLVTHVCDSGSKCVTRFWGQMTHKVKIIENVSGFCDATPNYIS